MNDGGLKPADSAINNWYPDLSMDECTIGLFLSDFGDQQLLAVMVVLSLLFLLLDTVFPDGPVARTHARMASCFVYFEHHLVGGRASRKTCAEHIGVVCFFAPSRRY